MRTQKKNFKELCKTEERYIQSLELLNYVSPKNTRDCEKDNNEGCELMFTESKRGDVAAAVNSRVSH